MRPCTLHLTGSAAACSWTTSRWWCAWWPTPPLSRKVPSISPRAARADPYPTHGALFIVLSSWALRGGVKMQLWGRIIVGQLHTCGWRKQLQLQPLLCFRGQPYFNAQSSRPATSPWRASSLRLPEGAEAACQFLALKESSHRLQYLKDASCSADVTVIGS